MSVLILLIADVVFAHPPWIFVFQLNIWSVSGSIITCSVLFRQRLFENLRMLPHAPGVQMQAIPEDAVQEDSGDEEDDSDKRIPSEYPVDSSALSLQWISFKSNMPGYTAWSSKN